MILKQAYWWMLRMGRRLAATLSPETLVRWRFRSLHGRWPDLTDPKTFDEKMCWLILNWLHPLKTRCGDKYTMRSYVEELGLGQMLPELLGVYERVEDIDFDALPRSFALKCSHGSKCNILCADKARLDVKKARRDLRRWMRTDYSKIYGELHYAGVRPRIICEPFLGDP